MAFLVSTAYHPAALAMHILIIRGFKIKTGGGYLF